ncbi:acetyl-CoA carboxylase biotin carboxylase subunit family protein [Amycolatopsis sp. DSM 110486]|uniref:ATP-grasp domain-containing protein n=1 Tax=Amycolatopsis sp. DSM 110486 TaxID=2865832 RepID=UPI001C69827B|nr:ATP-grasp domain-containing protein [Amycolatopsis sp. DSM 110486]QYN21264.1 ATP-grasp domain-containing protein [Amycolatopsis sp. DSM 110486]
MTKTLVVVYDDGAAHPGDIAVGLAGWAGCVFVVPPNRHTLAMAPLLARFGPVVVAESVSDAAAEVGRHRPDGLVTYAERGLGLAGELAGLLGLPFHDERTLRCLTDKWHQRAALRAAGVDVVRCRRIETAADWPDAVAETGLPAVLKPAHGGGSRNTYYVEDAETGLELVRRLLAEPAPGLVDGGTLVLEEYLPGRDCGAFGDYVSIESVVQDGVIADLAVTGKFPMVPPFRETGRFWPSPLGPVETAEVRELAAAAVSAVGLRTGLSHTEVKLTPAGPRLIEVNGRLGGGINELAVRARGINLVEAGGRIALGERVVVPDLYTGRAYFQVFHPAPRRAGTLVGIEGAEYVRDLAGVTLYRPYARPGTQFPGGVQTVELDIVMGETADVADLAPIVAKVESTLRYRFEFPAGEQHTVAAAELGAW